jgi:hypothetical protein
VQSLKNYPYFIEQEASLLHWQEHSTGLCSGKDQSSPHNPHHSSPKSILILPAHLHLCLLSGSFLLAFPPITYTRSSSPHSGYMPSPPHTPSLDNSNYTWRTVQIMKQFSAPSRHFIPPRSQYSPQHPVLKHPRSMFILLSDSREFLDVGRSLWREARACSLQWTHSVGRMQEFLCAKTDGWHSNHCALKH